MTWQGIEAPKTTIEFPAALFFSSSIKWIKLIPKAIGNRKKRLCVRLRSEGKHHLRKSADRKAQIMQEGVRSAHRTDLCFLICRFFRWCLSYNIRFGSGRTGSKIVSKFRLTHNRKLRSANRNTIDHTIACPALLLWCPAVEYRGPCVPKKCSLSNCASPGDSFCQVLDHWWSHGQHLLPIHSLMMTMYLPKISCRSKKTSSSA